MIGFEVGHEMDAAVNEEARVERGEERRTQLTAYFDYNLKNKLVEGEEATEKKHPAHLTYATAYRSLRYDKAKKEWKPYAKKHAPKELHLSRMKTVSARNLELLVFNYF